jgi:hypothetical protein
MWLEIIAVAAGLLIGYAAGYSVGVNEAYSSVRADLKELVDGEYDRRSEVNDMLREMDATRKDEGNGTDTGEGNIC